MPRREPRGPAPRRNGRRARDLSATWAFVVSAAVAAAIWAFSGFATGRSEPWDAPGAYYLVALALGGAISGAVVPRHLAMHYAGAIAGQVAYELLFLEVGALFVLGLAFLAGYGIVFLAAAAILAKLRNRGVDDATAA